jgi:hypothetical protein
MGPLTVYHRECQESVRHNQDIAIVSELTGCNPKCLLPTGCRDHLACSYRPSAQERVGETATVARIVGGKENSIVTFPKGTR